MKRSGRGFTLIELLVVIAIIALLLAIIVPSLNSAKQLAAAATCLSNCGQFAKAYYVYADENDGVLMDGKPATTSNGFMTFKVNGADYKTHCFVANPMNASGGYSNSSLEDKIRGFEKGALWPYINSAKGYNCPVDKRWLKAPLRPGSDSDLIGGYRSYSIGAVLSAGGYGETGSGEAKAVAIKYAEFTSPGSKIVFLEEADHSGKNDNYWDMYLNAKRWWDPVAIWHNGSSTFAFADGHADRHKWTDKYMIGMSTGDLPKGQVADPASDDYQWFKTSYIPGRMKP